MMLHARRATTPPAARRCAKLGAKSLGARCLSASASRDPFDAGVHRLHRDRAARAWARHGHEFEYLRDAVAERLVDRVEDIDRDLGVALDAGCHTGNLWAMLRKSEQQGRCAGDIRRLVQLDPSEAMAEAARARADGDEVLPTETHACGLADCLRVVQPESVDIALSNLALHWENELPRTLTALARTLKPDGVFLGAMLGGDTLFELRTALAFAEQEREGGISAHVSPMVRQADVCGLMSAAGLNLVTVDTETITVEYKDMFSCIEHLSAMGESNANRNRRPAVSRDTLVAAAAVYDELFADSEGYVPATFQIVYMIGWKPHESQPKPLRPQEADKSLGSVGRDLDLSPPAR